MLLLTHDKFQFRAHTVQDDGKYKISYTPCEVQKCGDLQEYMSVVSIIDELDLYIPRQNWPGNYY